MQITPTRLTRAGGLGAAASWPQPANSAAHPITLRQVARIVILPMVP